MSSRIAVRRFTFTPPLVLAAGVLFLACNRGATTTTTTKAFPSPEEAMIALVAAVETQSTADIEAIVGRDMVDAILADEDRDSEVQRKRLVRAARQQIKIEADPEDPSRQLAFLGQLEWPFPAPLVREGNAWRFDGEAGAVEVIYRRIGRNELAVLAMCMGYADAQDEYASVDHDGDGKLEYATRINSTPGRRDGLYWSTAEGEDLSPIGPFAAAAAMGETMVGMEPEPLNGYWAKVLAPPSGGTVTADAAGGDPGGLPPIVIWPAEYGLSGITTFVVNEAGEILEKDLGEETASLTQAMSAFTADPSWERAAGY